MSIVYIFGDIKLCHYVYFYLKTSSAEFGVGLYSVFEAQALKTRHTAPINTE